MPSTAVAQPPEVSETPPTEPQTIEPQPVADAPVAEVVAEATTETDQSPDAEPVSEDPEAEPATPYIPWGTYNPGVAPTAAVMVSRGIERYGEEKYQEAHS